MSDVFVFYRARCEKCDWTSTLTLKESEAKLNAEKHDERNHNKCTSEFRGYVCNRNYKHSVDFQHYAVDETKHATAHIYWQERTGL